MKINTRWGPVTVNKFFHILVEWKSGQQTTCVALSKPFTACLRSYKELTALAAERGMMTPARSISFTDQFGRVIESYRCE